MSFLKKIFIVLAMMGMMLPSFAVAQTDPTYGLQGASKGTGLINTKAGTPSLTLPELIGTIVGVALSFLGAVFFLLILYAGFLWMTAFGSSEKADKAKSILEHAAVGLVIVLASYAISRFVFDKLPGVADSTNQPATTVICSNIQTPVECNNQPDPVTSAPLCRWVGLAESGTCENNI